MTWSRLGTTSPTRRPSASHDSAALAPRARLRHAQLVAANSWTYSAAAKIFTGARQETPSRWFDRSWVRGRGAGRTSADRRPAPAAGLDRACATGLLPHQPPGRDRPGHRREPLRRCEPDRSAALIQVDVTNLGNVPTAAGIGCRSPARLQTARDPWTAAAARTTSPGSGSRSRRLTLDALGSA